MTMTLKSTIAALLAAAATTVGAQEEIKIGACQPITGRFAFAGGQLNAGLGDSVAFANEQGLVKGKKLTYFFEDTGYDTEKAVATFKKMMAQQNPAIMYGESTGQGKAIAPELNAKYKIMYGSTSFSSELADPKTHPYSFVSGPTYSDQFGILLQYIAKGAAKGKRPKVAFFYSDTEFGKDPIAWAQAARRRAGHRRGRRGGGQGRGGRRDHRGAQPQEGPARLRHLPGLRHGPHPRGDPGGA